MNTKEIEFMLEALEEARKAMDEDEVPVGAVVVIDEQIVARAHNQMEQNNDATAHAEILALQIASAKYGRRLNQATIFTTLEPCPMCAGAIILARIKKLVYGADDPKAGAAGSVINLFQPGLFNHNVEVKGGLLEKECGILISEFFQSKRIKK